MNAEEKLVNEVRRLEKALLEEANYCFEHAAKYRIQDPSRANRHRERGMRLLKAVLPDANANTGDHPSCT